MTDPCPGVPAALPNSTAMPDDDSLHITLATPMRCPTCDKPFTLWWVRHNTLLHWPATTGGRVLPADARDRLARHWFIADHWQDKQAGEKWDSGKVPVEASRRYLANADRSLTAALGDSE